ncbi:MAG TPA: ribokinase [Aggregatilineales bacterium]|nr:ribokinase [Aggregatilineales bacterium]
MGKQITVVGSFAVGMTLRTNRMPIFGETLIGADFDMGPGGKGSNQAVGTARLGASSYFVGIIGDDKLGEIATDLYAAEGVNTQYLHKTRDMATGVGFIILNQAGENGIILDMSANKLMDAAFVDKAETLISRSDIVLSVLEIPVAAAARAMELGRKHGVRTLLNPAPAARLDDAAIRNVDYITPNETELRILMGLSPDDPTPTPDLAKQLKARGAKNIIVTMGEKGALVLSDEASTQVPRLEVDVVDTTGAGDAFNSGLAVALTEGKDLIDAVKFANCAGALACTKLGVIPSLAKRDVVDRFYAQHYA